MLESAGSGVDWLHPNSFVKLSDGEKWPRTLPRRNGYVSLQRSPRSLSPSLFPIHSILNLIRENSELGDSTLKRDFTCDLSMEVLHDSDYNLCRFYKDVNLEGSAKVRFLGCVNSPPLPARGGQEAGQTT